MSVAIICKDCPGVKTPPWSAGFSPESEKLRSYFSDVIDHTQEPVSIGRPLEEALESLKEMYDECSQENWDQYGASPISGDAYHEAVQLIKALPSYAPMPEVSPHPTGGIGLEWYASRCFSFVVEVTGKRVIYYAGLFGGNTTHGEECFRESLSSTIMEYLQRLYRGGGTNWGK